MQVIVPVKVSAQEFYEVLIMSLQEEVEKVTGKKRSEKELEGIKYKKKSSANEQDVKVHVRQLKKNKKYVNSFSMGTASTKVIYEFRPLSDYSCEVIYTEEYSKEPKKSLLNPPTRRAKKMIRAAEKYIIEHRNR